MKRSIVLGGMKHCGKSTHGKLLAQALHCDFLDTDDLLAERYGAMYEETLTPREIFRKHGEAFFRRLEADVIAALAYDCGVPRVVALGGGVPANRFVREDDLRALGVFVYLAIDAATAFARVAAGGLPPFLEQELDPEQKFAELYRERDAFYRKYADVTILIAGDEPVDQVGARLLALEGMNE